MFYHIYFLSRENNSTIVEYKKSTTAIGSITIDNIPHEKLIIPLIVSTETEELLPVESILTHKSLIVSNPIFKVTKPFITKDSKNNISCSDTQVKFYNEQDMVISLPLQRKDLDYSKNTFSLYAIAYRNIKEYIPELDLTIDKEFYSNKSDLLTLQIKESITHIPYTLRQVKIDTWEINNNTKYTIQVQKEGKDERKILPYEIVNLTEGTYFLKVYEGIVEYSGELSLVNSISDLTNKQLTIKAEQINEDIVKISWNTIDSEVSYKIYYNGKLQTTVRDISFYMLKIPKDTLHYDITVVATNYFTETKNSITVYAFDKPSIPTYNIRGINDVVFTFDSISFKHAKLIVYGVEHSTNKYIKLGTADARTNEFKLTKEMLEYSTFVYRYSLNNSYSEYSKEFNFEHPLIYNRKLMIQYPKKITDKYWEYTLKWCPDRKAQGYAVYKNNIKIAELSATTSEYTDTGYVGDFLCLHSYYGLKEAESSILPIGIITDKLPIRNVLDLKIDKIVDRRITVSWEVDCVNLSFVDLFVFDKNYNKIKVFSNLTDTKLSFNVPDYDQYYIKVRTKRKEDVTDKTELSSPLWFKTYKAGKSIVREDCLNSLFIYDMDVIDELVNPEYVIEMTHPDTGDVTVIHSETNIVELPIDDTKPRDIRFYINSGIITTGVSDNYHYKNANEIVFHASIVQVSNLPDTFGNFLKIDIDDSVNSKTLPLSDFVSIEELSKDSGIPITPYFEEFYRGLTFGVKGVFKKACRYNIKIEKSNGEIIEFNDIHIYDTSNSLIFKNQFNSKFYNSNRVNQLTSIPFTIDLEELVDATVTITGIRLNHSYTVVLDYKCQQPVKPIEVTKVIADYKGDNLGYSYTINWIQEPDTLYKIINIDTGDKYDLKTNTITINSLERVNNFTIASYNAVSISNPVELSFKEILPVTNVSTEDGNRIVTMDFTGVDNITHYELYVDNNLHQITTDTNFLLKPFRGQKDVTIRGVYKEGIYEVYGIPTIYTYTPARINDTYTIIYDIISGDRFIRTQIENDTVEDSVRWINFVVRNRPNAVVYERTLDMPIDDFKHIFEVVNTSDLSTIYVELVNGWSIARTNIIDLRDRLFLFGANPNSFGSYFE